MTYRFTAKDVAAARARVALAEHGRYEVEEWVQRLARLRLPDAAARSEGPAPQAEERRGVVTPDQRSGGLQVTAAAEEREFAAVVVRGPRQAAGAQDFPGTGQLPQSQPLVEARVRPQLPGSIAAQRLQRYEELVLHLTSVLVGRRNELSEGKLEQLDPETLPWTARVLLETALEKVPTDAVGVEDVRAHLGVNGVELGTAALTLLQVLDTGPAFPSDR